jgi:hypothetical protein
MDEQVVVKHGGFGIASFIISVVVLILVFALIAIAGIMKSSDPQMMSAIDTILGLIFILSSFIGLIGIGLGVAGAIQKKSKKVFPVLGIVIGTGTFVLYLILVVIGMQMASKV